MRNHISEAIANLYSSGLDDSGTIPSVEAKIDYELFSELKAAQIDTGDAIEAILTGYASFAQTTLPDAKSLNPDQLKKVQSAIVKYILSSGVNGFKDGIESISFDSDPFHGSFIQAGTERKFEYTIEEEGGQYVSSVSAASGVED